MKRNRLLFGTAFILFSVFVSLISCRKNELVPLGQIQSNEELQKTFFNTSTTNDVEIQKLADNIKKQKSLLKSLPDFVRKNGIPKWDKVLYKTKPVGGTSISTNSLNKSSVGGSEATQGVFFIPLQSENSTEVKSYITAYKHNDSLYTYRLYNKDSLNNVHPSTNTTKNNLLNTQAVFGYFEKTINNVDSVNISSPLKTTIKNVNISFDKLVTTNSVKGDQNKSLSVDDGCLMTIFVTIEFWCDGSCSVTVSIDVSCGGGDGSPGGPDPSSPDNGNNWWNYGTGWPWNNPGGPYYSDPSYYPGSNGYNNSNWYWWWTSNPGLTPIQSFIYTLTPSESNFWNDPLNFSIVTDLANKLNQENVSADSQDFVKWAIDYLIANPSIPIGQFENQFLGQYEGEDGPNNFNQSYWDDPNLVIPTQTLPSYQDFYNNFPNIDADAVYNLIGGPILANRQFDPANYSNACALRVSRALNYSGKTIPAVNGTEKGADGKNYFLSAKALNAYMRKAFGPPTDHFTQTQGGRNGENFPNLIAGKKGIYSMIASGWVASGHADLFTGTICKRGCDITKFTTTIDIWELQ